MVIILYWKSAIGGNLRVSMAQENVLEHRERLVFLCLILAQGVTVQAGRLGNSEAGLSRRRREAIVAER